ncbi:MAG: aldolase/citrate lyase family protein [Geminicoccaceae bacterium]
MGKIRPNRAKEKLAAGGIVVSLGGLASSDLIDQIGPMGLDAVWLEAEHGPVDYGHIGDLTRACDLWGMTSIVRVNSLDYGTIYRVLDLGAQAICVPHVDTANVPRASSKAAKFAPIGRRTSRAGRASACPTTSRSFQRPDHADRPHRGCEGGRARCHRRRASSSWPPRTSPPPWATSARSSTRRCRAPSTGPGIAAAGRTPGALLLGHQNVARYTALGVRYHDPGAA